MDERPDSYMRQQSGFVPDEGLFHVSRGLGQVPRIEHATWLD
jgi:hypothetical protein